MPDKDIILNGAEPVQALAAQLCAEQEVFVREAQRVLAPCEARALTPWGIAVTMDCKSR